jgi:hypothetical protein
LALFFEFINGFHDTANAVATVIYTRSLPAGGAVIWSGIWEFYWGTLIHRDSCLQRGRNPSSVEFLRHLERKGIEVPEPPQRQANPDMPFVKVNVKEGVPEAKLEQVLEDFMGK